MGANKGGDVMRTKTLVIGGAVLVIVAGAAWAGRNVYATAHIGATYVAKQTCSCLFVARRTEESCRTDYNAADLQRLKVAPGAGEVTVSALGGLISGRAAFEQGFGCHPVK
jgi:hypothetical protein